MRLRSLDGLRSLILCAKGKHTLATCERHPARVEEKAGIMSEQPTINIADLSKADVLAALFNAAEAPRRMGALQFDNGPYVMTKEWAAKLVKLGSAATPDYGGIIMPGRSTLYFDYLYGRCLKVDLTDDDTFDPWGFDRDNGGDGSAKKVIDQLRETGEVSTVPDYEPRVWLRKVIDISLERYDEGDVGGAIAQFLIGTRVTLERSTFLRVGLPT